MDKSLKNSKIFGFIAMGFSILSIPMIFLDLMSVNALGYSFGNFNIVSCFDDDDLLILAIVALISVVFSLITAILSIFSKKATRIIALITSFFGFGATLANMIIIMIASSEASKESFGLGSASPGVGTIMMLIFTLIAFVFAIMALVFQIKAGKANLTDIDGGFGGTPIDGTDDTINIQSGIITFLSGSCAGYQIPVNGGEEILIGKDPSQCSVVIDRKYTKVSRKHCGVRYDSMQGIYLVTDYSTNGTRIVGGEKLMPNSTSYLERGTSINLAGTENTFRLD